MRLGCLTFIILVTGLLLISCAKEIPDFKETDIKTPVIDETIGEENEEITEEVPFEEKFEYKITKREWMKIRNSLSHKEKAQEFMSAIHLGDREILEIYMQGDTIDELLKIKADFVITGEKTFVEYFDEDLRDMVAVENDDTEGHEKYKDEHPFDCYLGEILMTVSESESDIFPVGVYEYTIKITDSGTIFVDYFGPRDRYEIFEGSMIPPITDTAHFKNHRFLRDFFSCNTTTYDKSIDPVTNLGNVLHIAVHALMSLEEDFVFETTLDEFKEYIRLRFGYTDEGTLEKFADTLSKKWYATLNDDGSYSVSCGHGSAALMYDLTRIKTDGVFHTYFYTFYADSAHTVPVKEVHFTFEENKDSDIMTLRLIKEATLNDLNQALISP